MNRPLWSVMIPTYEPQEKFIISAINSVLEQDRGSDKMQIEVVDDCSKKVDVEKIINDNWNERVTYHRLSKNVGHSFNFTECIKRSKGELIHFLHEDDMVKPGFYSTFENIFKNYTKIGAAFCRQEYIDEEGKLKFYSPPEMDEPGILEDALVKLAEKQRIQYCAMVIRRKVFEQLGGFIPKNIGCEDWEMWVRIAKSYPIAYEPQALASYRVHNESSMTLKDIRTGQDMRHMREAAEIFTQYLPEEKREEVTLSRNKHYAAYSLENAKKLYEEFNDEEGAAAQLSETILLSSEFVYENIDFLSKFKLPIESTGVSVIINCNDDDDEKIEITLRNLISQHVPEYLPWEIVLVDNSNNDKTNQTATEFWDKHDTNIHFKYIKLEDSTIYKARKTAIDNSKYNFIIFCDPGKLLNLNYVETVSNKMLEDSSAGAIGGITKAVSNFPLPEWFKDWSNFCYQTGEQFEYSGDITWSRGYLWSAGMAIRKTAWDSVFKNKFNHYFSKSKNKLSQSCIDSEICFGLRLNGWKIMYLFDLRLKVFISKSEANWNYFRRIWRQAGKNSVVLQPFINLKLKDAGNLKIIQKNKNQRLLFRANYRKLRGYKDWKLRSYSEKLENDFDILQIEYLSGSLSEILKSFGSYNKKVRFLKRVIRKKDFKFFKFIFKNPPSRFPQYKRKIDTRGVSVIVDFRNTSLNLLNRALENISKQELSKDFPWEVIVISNSITDETADIFYQKWKGYNCTADLKIETNPAPKPDYINIRKLALKKSKFEYLLFIHETDFIQKDFIRIAYKVLKKNKRAGVIGGMTELISDVKSPKWFDSHKHYYSIGAPSDVSEDITDRFDYFWRSGVVARRSAIRELKKYNFKHNHTLNENLEPEFICDYDLFIAMRLNGWRIQYEQRLKIKHYVPVNKFNWEHLIKLYYCSGVAEVRKSRFLRFMAASYKLSKEEFKVYNPGKAFKEINRYPVKKLISGNRHFPNDEEVLQIEMSKGRLNEVISSGSRRAFRIVNKNGSASGKNGAGKMIRTLNGSVDSSRMKKGVSIVVCCYNSSKILPATLKYLFRQNVPNNIPWEIIIVDNASTDNTSETAQKIYDKHNCLAPLRIVKEPKAGLSNARQKGFDTARYEYIILCDDDNFLKDDFVKTVYGIMSSNRKIGILGGQGKAEFEISKPDWFNNWKNSYAVGKQSMMDGDITASRGYVWGASMVVRKEAWKKLTSRGFRTLLKDRTGKDLSSGGDTEICYALKNDGWLIWYDQRLKFKHFISAERLNWNYIKKLFRGFGKASPVLDIYLNNPDKGTKRKSRISLRNKLQKSISILRKTRYKKLLSYNKKREGDSDIPMIEYCLGRLEGLLKTRKSYNRSLKLLKRATRKNDHKYLKCVFKNYDKNFPRYKSIKKLNGVSVIVCTYNGGERLADTIRHIAKQKVDPRILWEVILVDNASTDNSKEVTINEWKKHKCNAKLRIVDQPVPGKQLALEKGYEVSNYEYLVTCDDDNWLEENFVQLTYDIMSSNKNIGALGGPNEPLCELQPPEWFKYFQRDYAAGPQGDIHTGEISVGNITWKRGYVWGAGMIVRKSAWYKLIEDGFRTSMSCRKGTELSSGGDSEACYALVLAGWEIWYDPRLKLKHCMPAGRLDWNYLTRLFVGFGVASVGLEIYEKAIQLARADVVDEDIKKQNWRYEFKKTLKALRGYGLKKILSLRFSQNNNTEILMLEFNISRLRELIKIRKEYDKTFEELINSPWKKQYGELKANHRKFLESENDYRYGWPWSEEPPVITEKGMRYPKISILSPSFNSEGTIEKAILSVLRQGYPNFEHIIFDGGSKDNTVEILKKYPHVKWVSEPDKGQSDAMNKAFNASTGDIIAYLNVDDYFQRGAFLKVAKAFEENPESEIVVGNLFFDFADHTFMRKPETDYKKIMLPFRYMFPINPVSYFYKRNVQQKVGPFPIDNHFTMDYWFLLKAYQNHKLTKIEDFLGTFCMNGYNKTSNADNRKNTHHRVLYHCWNYDRKLLPYYMYNYYKFFYYDKKPYNLKAIGNKAGKYWNRVWSVLTLKKNRLYSQKLFEKSRYRYYEKKRIRSVMNGILSFLIYPKGVFQRSKQSQFIYSVLGTKYSEKAKLVYFFFTTPPGLPLGNKIHYYAREYKKDKKSLKGNSLLLLTYIISPKFILKDREHQKSEKPKTILYYLNPLNWIKGLLNFFGKKKYKEKSYKYYDKACEKYYFHKNVQATLLMLMSFLVYPFSIRMKPRYKLFCYSAFGNTITEKLVFAKHLYKDNPEYSFAHKLNYYGNELVKQNSSFKGNLILDNVIHFVTEVYFQNGKRQ